MKETKKLIEFRKWLKRYLEKGYGKRCASEELGCMPCALWRIFDNFSLFVDYQVDLDSWLKPKDKKRKNPTI